MDIGFAGALVGGILALLSPCSVMLLPAFFAYAFTSKRQLFTKTAVFYLGLAVTLVPLGVFASTLGGLVTQNRYVLIYSAATLIIVIGVLQVTGIGFGWLRLPGKSRAGSGFVARASSGGDGSALSVFVLGAVYAVAGVCAGPILGSVLTMAALGGNAVYGGLLLALYGLGMVIPLFILAAVWSGLSSRGRETIKPRSLRIGRWQNSWVMIASGLLSIGIGFFLILTDGTESLGGFFSVNTQYEAETWVTSTVSRIPNYWFVVGLLMLLVVVAGVVWVMRTPGARQSEQAAQDQLPAQPDLGALAKLTQPVSGADRDDTDK